MSQNSQQKSLVDKLDTGHAFQTDRLQWNRTEQSVYWLGYGLQARAFAVRFPQRQEINLFSKASWLPGPHPVCYSAGTNGPLPVGIAAGAWSWPLNPTECRCRHEWSYTATPPYASMTFVGQLVTLPYVHWKRLEFLPSARAWFSFPSWKVTDAIYFLCFH
jgi:hypothetical protein